MNINWKDHVTNADIYGEGSRFSSKIRQRRLRLAGHCIRHPEELAHNLVFWEKEKEKEGKRKRGRQVRTFIDNILDDTGLESTAEVKSVMLERDLWKNVYVCVRPGGRPK